MSEWKRNDMKSLINPVIDRISSGGGKGLRTEFYILKLTHAVLGLASSWCIIENASAASLSTAEPLRTARGSQTATLLTNGKLLVAGGQTSDRSASAAAELYDPATGTWAATGSMNAAR